MVFRETPPARAPGRAPLPQGYLWPKSPLMPCDQRHRTLKIPKKFPAACASVSLGRAATSRNGRCPVRRPRKRMRQSGCCLPTPPPPLGTGWPF